MLCHQSTYAKANNGLKGDDLYWARREYASTVRRNPEIAAAKGFPKYAHMKMVSK
jgi:hypothetical protein